ncbi:MAG: chromate transporter [Lachnospiraceae bacterium]|jgi:chromate transporter|nr:chromate transporter [Lachnospiraceae bacterium]MCH4030804.1 chromate transporter [Lachnospiraceae bacterium]MCH4070776.1 chromate transporter [Lachnospiraceae bacterium]MCH4107048.1 chromate transporter [Lachnospiraceae bacterium]MCI1302096.1 chromate transporter [Lachnospiraceae bacterium]
MIYLELFLAFLHIGAFSFGGGYAAMPLIQEQVIDKYHWMTIADFTDLVTISQMTPGPIAVNAATFVGTQIAGIPGAIMATAGVCLPSCIFVSVLAWLYVRYRNLSIMKGVLTCLRPAVTAMIFAAGLLILVPALFPDGIAAGFANFQVRQLIYFVAALVCLRKFKIGPIKVMVGCGAAELAVRLIMMAAGM